MSSANTLSPPRPTRPSFFRSLSSSSSAHGLTNNLSPRRDKPRLYLALYSRGGTSSMSSYSSSLACDSYHWCLLVGPQAPSRREPGTCYQITHANSSPISGTYHTQPFYEETDLSQQSEAQSQALLARIALAKVLDENRLQTLLRGLPPSSPLPSQYSDHSDSDYDTDTGYGTSTCLTWVKAAYKALTSDSKCLRGYIAPEDWADVEDIARMYMKRKRRQGRFGGRGVTAPFRTWNVDEIPTWNFWENRETTD